MNAKNVITKIMFASVFSIFALTAQAEEKTSTDYSTITSQATCEMTNWINKTIQESMDNQIEELNKEIAKSLSFELKKFDVLKTSKEEVEVADYNFFGE